MRFSLFLLFGILFFPLIVFSQSDTTVAGKNLNKAEFYIDNTGKIKQKPIKDIGNGIPHLVIFNLANNNVLIKLSTNGENWSEFSLNPITKNLYRCDNIQKMFVIINPTSSNPIKAKIYRSKKYKIIYDNQLKIFDIQEI